MIYTVTLNPSIDFIVRIDKVDIGEVDNTATGFIGGFTGRFVTDSLDAEGIKTT